MPMILFFAMTLCIQAHAAWVCKKDVCVQVEVVSKDEDLRRGLQGRDVLADRQGMLFVFKSDGFYRFWMKDMKFPLDMIWIDRQHHIVTIAPSRLPCDQDPCPVYEPSTKARYCLEVPDGFALKNQLQTGDLLEFKDI